MKLNYTLNYKTQTKLKKKKITPKYFKTPSPTKRGNKNHKTILLGVLQIRDKIKKNNNNNNIVDNIVLHSWGDSMNASI